jgi:DNA-directed RNA polymerase specialized sigma24 family protein
MANVAMPAGTPATSTDDAFAALYSDYRTRVEAYIVTRLPRPDRQLAEDLATETFLSLWKHLQAGQVIERPFGLLATMAARRVYDHYRKASNVRETAMDTTHWSFANRNLAPAASGAYEPIRNGHAGDSDPNMDEALRRARESKPRAMAGAA